MGVGGWLYLFAAAAAVFGPASAGASPWGATGGAGGGTGSAGAPAGPGASLLQWLEPGGVAAAVAGRSRQRYS